MLLSETPDLIGVEKELFERCGDSRDRKNLEQLFASHKHRLAATGECPDDLEMVAFNVAGGLKTLRDKARVSLMKAGGGPIAR